MVEQKGTQFVSDRIGTVSTLFIEPPGATHLLLMGHGAGAGMEHPFMADLAQCLADKRLATLRYQFPYIEKGKRRPDVPAVAHKTIEACMESAAERFHLPLVLSGKSFGGRMSSQFVAAKNPDQVSALVFFGFPLHSPAKPGNERGEHLKEIDLPMLFLQGDRDNLARLNLLRPLIDTLPQASLVVLNGASHGFSFTKKSGITNEQGLALLATYTREFLDKI